MNNSELEIENQIDSSKKCNLIIDGKRIKRKKINNRLNGLDEKTIGQLKSKSKHKTWFSSVLKHARKQYKQSGRKYICESCGYNKYIEIAHIKGRSTFPLETKIKDVNHIDNLVALCSNCHWEFDKHITPFEKLCPHIKPIYGVQQCNVKSKNKSRKHIRNVVLKNADLSISQLKQKFKNMYINTIREHSNRLYLRSDKYKKCYCCDYDKHIEICHIKAVSEFGNNSLLGEINNLNNLIALCPNHHKELDKEIRTLDEICSQKDRNMKDEYQYLVNQAQIIKKKNDKIKRRKTNRKCKYCDTISFEWICGKCIYNVHKRNPRISQRKVKERPSLEQIYADIQELKTKTAVGKKYGVTRNLINAWIRDYERSSSK